MQRVGVVFAMNGLVGMAGVGEEKSINSKSLPPPAVYLGSHQLLLHFLHELRCAFVGLHPLLAQMPRDLLLQSRVFLHQLLHRLPPTHVGASQLELTQRLRLRLLRLRVGVGVLRVGVGVLRVGVGLGVGVLLGLWQGVELPPLGLLAHIMAVQYLFIGKIQLFFQAVDSLLGLLEQSGLVAFLELALQPAQIQLLIQSVLNFSIGCQLCGRGLLERGQLGKAGVC